MKKSILLILGVSAVISLTANAQIVTYNNTITPLVGTGNTSGGWTTASENGIDLSLRAQSTIPGPGDLTPNNNAGTFTFPSGTTGTFPGYFVWDYWFDINPGTVSGLTYSLVITGGASGPITITLSSSFPPDNGHNGTEFQNAENLAFSGLNGNNPATYVFTLDAIGSNGQLADSVSMDVNNGATPVPEASTWIAGASMMLPLGLSGLRMLRRKKA